MSPSYWQSEAWKWMPAVFGVGCKVYSPELNKRCQPHLKRTNKSYRIDETYDETYIDETYIDETYDETYIDETYDETYIDETYIKVKGQDKYLYRAVDSTGQTIDFLLTAKRDTAAAKLL
jgi:transposase-like protein